MLARYGVIVERPRAPRGVHEVPGAYSLTKSMVFSPPGATQTNKRFFFSNSETPSTAKSPQPQRTYTAFIRKVVWNCRSECCPSPVCWYRGCAKDVPHILHDVCEAPPCLLRKQLNFPLSQSLPARPRGTSRLSKWRRLTCARGVFRPFVLVGAFSPIFARFY